MNYTEIHTLSSPFDKLSLIDKLSLVIPYQIYKPSTWIYSQIGHEVISFAILISIALGCVLVGAFSTVNKPVNAGDPSEDVETEKWDCTDNDECNYYKSTSNELELINIESIGWKHALSMPFVGAVVLYGLYYGMTKINKDNLVVGLNWYILCMSFFPNYQTYHYCLTVLTRRIQKHFAIGPIFKRYRITLARDIDNYPLGVVEPIDKTKYEKLIRHLRIQGIKIIKPNMVKIENQITNVIFDLKFLCIIPLSLATSYAFYKFNPILNNIYQLSQTNWIISNVLGINFAIFGINKTRISSFKVAFILLFGLFFYDIYFVFGTKIMVTVATGLDIPIKISIPRSPTIYYTDLIIDLYEILSDTKHWNIPTSILGLGDIVIPGAFISLCLRFDLFKYHENNDASFHHLQNYPKPYFIVSVVSYTVGLVLTVSVLYFYKMGQPALLYIVPCLAGGTVFLSLAKGEFKQLLDYTEEIEEFKEKEKDEGDGQEQHEDEDSEYSVGEDSEWERLAEEQMEIDEAFEVTDLDEVDLLIEDQSNPVQIPITYEFDTDDDDDTFIIVSDESSESEDNEDADSSDDDSRIL